MERETYAELFVESDVLSPDQITSILGLTCDRCFVKGTPMPKRNRLYGFHGWSIRTFLSEDATLDDHVASLLERLAPVREKVRQVSSHAKVDFCCVIQTPKDERPPLQFNRQVIAALAEMGAGLSVDMYFISEDPP